MIKVHHLNNSRSQRILWLLEELEAPYEVVSYKRDRKTQLAPATLKKVHPLGKSPVIEDDGFVVAESGAIIEYLVEKFDVSNKLMPQEIQAKTNAKTWLHYAEGSIMPLFFLAMIMNKMEEKSPFFIRPITKQLTKAFRDAYLDRNLIDNIKFIADSLSDKPYLLGESLTVADIAMSFPIEAFVTHFPHDLFDPKDVERLTNYGREFQEREAYQRALLRGGDYAYLIV